MLECHRSTNSEEELTRSLFWCCHNFPSSRTKLKRKNWDGLIPINSHMYWMWAGLSVHHGFLKRLGFSNLTVGDRSDLLLLVRSLICLNVSRASEIYAIY